jgi:hypothetical protein
MKDQVLVDHGYVDQDGAAYYDALTDKIVETAVALPNSNGNRINTDGALGSILLTVLPNLKVANFDNDEEKDVYTKLYSVVSRTCGVGVTSPVQRALAEDNRVLCRGKIPTKTGDPVEGIWISDNPKTGGPIDSQFDRIIEQWAKKSNSVIKWGDMAVRRQPKYARAAIAALEAHQKEVQASIAGFKVRALAMASEADTNGHVEAELGEAAEVGTEAEAD